MRLISKMSENIKRGIRNWLNLTPSAPASISINQVADFELTAIRNRIWYRGDSNELEQLYLQDPDYADKKKFWGSRCTPGMEMRKIHTGLPGLIIKVISGIVLTDLNKIEFKVGEQEELWKKIDKQNKFRKKLKKALKEMLYIGDGAWKVTINTRKKQYPILMWYPGDRVEFVYEGDELQEVIFKTAYKDGTRQYILYEHYGYGYINYELYKDNKEVPITEIFQTSTLQNYTFDQSVLMAVPMLAYENTKYEGRGGSLFDGKLDSFDAFDEAWSQWMDALRAGRARTYIPESYIPRDKETGSLMRPNPFDNRFISGTDNMDENGKNTIQTEQPEIPHESYLASYVTALDLCLQGIISPSTLGIDIKKLDNAEAQREKEKTTLYTRDTIIEALQETLPEIITAGINAYNILHKKAPEEVKVTVSFGEYANPSFESQVETVGKGKTQGVMSVEACVEELYGDTKEETWKQAEIARLKNEQGIATVEEPELRKESGFFSINAQGDTEHASKDSKAPIQNEPGKVPGTS